VGENLILGTNDPVLNSIGLAYGKSVNEPGIRLINELQPVVQADDYRRVLRSFRDQVVSTGVETTWVLNFLTSREESRRWVLAELGGAVGIELDILGSIQRGSSAQLNSVVLRGGVSANNFAIQVGAGERISLGLGADKNYFFPNEIIQPPNCVLTFKITAGGGGNFGVGALDFQGSYFVIPTLRSWEATKADSETFA